MKICTLNNLFSNFLWCYKPSTVIDVRVWIINYRTDKRPSWIKLCRSRTVKLQIYQLIHFNAWQIVHLSRFQPVSFLTIQCGMTTKPHCGLDLHLDTTRYSFCSRKWYISGSLSGLAVHGAVSRLCSLTFSSSQHMRPPTVTSSV